VNDLFLKLRINDHAGWEQACGSLFISSLREISTRCLVMALLVYYKRHGREFEDEMIGEIYESLGTFFYSQLLAGQGYGYPMHVMPDARKIEIADAAMQCFRRSISVFQQSSTEALHNANILWDVYLMTGKVSHEREMGKVPGVK
jgi:hypothetical protein